MSTRKSLFNPEDKQEKDAPVDWTYGALQASIEAARQHSAELKQIDTSKPWYEQVLQRKAAGFAVTPTALEMALDAQRIKGRSGTMPEPDAQDMANSVPQPVSAVDFDDIEF